MGKIRKNYKNAKGNKAINEFLGVVVGAVNSGSLNAMQKVARRGVENLVNNVAKFSDYTGVLINSYQAAIIVRGQMGVGKDFNLSGDVIGRGGRNEFRNGQNSVRLITSYNINGTTPISFKTVENKGTSFAKRKERNPQSKRTIPNRYKFRAKGSAYKGYGRDLTALRTYTPASNLGIEVVFNNPTPYANHVATQNAGSTVMPVGSAARIVPQGIIISITDAEIYRAVEKAKKRIRR